MFACYDDKYKISFFYIEQNRGFGWMRASKELYERNQIVKINENDVLFIDSNTRSIQKIDRIRSSIVGANYLANIKKNKIGVIYWDTPDDCSYFLVNRSKNFAETQYLELNNTSLEDIENKVDCFLLAGSQFYSPEKLREIGYRLPNHKFFIYEFGDAVVTSFGGLIDGVIKNTDTLFFKSTRYDFSITKEEEFSFPSSNFLGEEPFNNCYGNMAVGVGSNEIVYNDIYQTPSDSVFFNKYLMLPRQDVDGTYFVLNKNVSEFFDEPKSITESLAYCLPVKMKPNDKFKEQIGYDVDYVNVRIVNINDNTILYKFTTMLETITNKKIFMASGDHPEIKSGVANSLFWFRHNKFYIIADTMFQNKE